MRRSLDYCWPKAESVLYGEPKRLVQLGLATATREPAGRRSRTVYDITEQGRRLLAEWLATPPGPPRLELEVMLRLLYADQAGREELLEAIRATREWARGYLPDALGQVRGYLADGGPFPELFGLLLDWTDTAEAEVREWPGTAGLGLTEGTREQLEAVLDRLEAMWASRSA
jgi:PadR family transcriptional regulator AphA